MSWDSWSLDMCSPIPFSYVIEKVDCNYSKKNIIWFDNPELVDDIEFENGLILAQWIKSLIDLKDGESPKSLNEFRELTTLATPYNSEYLVRQDLTVRIHGKEDGKNYVRKLGYGKNEINLFRRISVVDYSDEDPGWVEELETLYLLVDENEIKKFNAFTKKYEFYF